MMELSLINQAASALAWPPHIQILPVEGDAMAPTFKEGDYLAVDTLQRNIREGVYALQSGDTVIFRRVIFPVAGFVHIGCDNKLCGDPKQIPAETLSKLILGRVIFAETRIY